VSRTDPRKTLVEPGQRYGRLVVLKRLRHGGGHVVWEAQCDCGNTHEARGDTLRHGVVRSCGCLAREESAARGRLRATHGMSRVGARRAEHDAWVAMRQRCGNANHPQWRDYGGRGITVCESWLASFEAFFADVGERPTAKHSLGRIDNERGYEPGNVRWETTVQQGRNTRAVKLNEAAVCLIRHMYRRRAAAKDLGHAFGITEEHARRVAQGKAWR
jgi:hypothetical protein